MSEIEIYTSSDNKVEIQVKLESETVWLTQKQIADVFGTQRPAITKHLKNLFSSGELIENAVSSKMELTAEDNKTYKTQFYNLDAVLSIGYRVNSKQATHFRQWATQRLKEHLVQGYTLNQKRLDQLQQTIQLIERTGKTDELQLSEAKGLLDIISNYTKSFVLLNRFDSNNLEAKRLNDNITYEIQHEEALDAIAELKRQMMGRNEATQLFGNPKDDSFQGILGNIVQTFGGEYLYPSIEAQAAHLLYFVIKNHPFSDGNKRIGAFLFVWFLEKNKHRFKQSGEVKINDNALIALALLVAQSNPSDKELMIKLIINLIVG